MRDRGTELSALFDLYITVYRIKVVLHSLLYAGINVIVVPSSHSCYEYPPVMRIGVWRFWRYVLIQRNVSIFFRSLLLDCEV